MNKNSRDEQDKSGRMDRMEKQWTKVGCRSFFPPFFILLILLAILSIL
jgi:hypothetical protein